MTRPLTVAFVTETFPPEINGAAMTAGRLLDGLASYGHVLRVVRPRQPADGALRGLPNRWLAPGVALPLHAGLQLGLPSRWMLRCLWRRRRPDVVHVVTEGPLGLSALGAARELGIPVTSAFHTNFHTYLRSYGLRLLQGVAVRYLRWFHNRTACTMVPTAQARQDLERLGFRHVTVLSRGVDTALFSPGRRRADLRRAWGVGPDTPVALFVGRLAPEKNVPLALDAFRAVGRARPDVRLVMVGTGPLHEKLARRHRDVIFSGVQRGEDLAAHYASADLLLFPSLTETFGNVVLEGMASGLAVLAFDDAAAREHVNAPDNGQTVAPGDEAAFVRAAVDLASDLGRIRAMGARARATALGLGWEAVQARFAAILAQVAAAGPLEQGAPEAAPRPASPIRRAQTQAA